MKKIFRNSISTETNVTLLVSCKYYAIHLTTKFPSKLRKAAHSLIAASPVLSIHIYCIKR